ncbi:MAG: hypothetical protein ACRDUV_24745 [Pseudonocardiaceae bacterium]
MSEWVVRVDVDTRVPLDEEVLVALSETAETRAGSVSNRANGPGYTVTLDVEADGALAAANDGARFALTELGADFRAELVDLRVTTPERFEAEALRPDFPPLASAADAAEILGVSRQRVHQLAASNTRFPAPVARVGTGPLWTVPAIEHFASVWDRRPGRPAASTATEPGELPEPRREADCPA